MIEIFRSKKNKQYYFRVLAKNGKVIAQSEGYKRKDGAVKGILSLMRVARNALRIVYRSDRGNEIIHV